MRRNGLPREPDLNEPYPKRLVKSPLFWLTVVMLLSYAVLLVLLYRQTVPDREVPGGTLPGLGTEAVPIAAKYAAITAIPLSLIFLWADRFRPQRFWVWLMTFGWGACVATYVSAQVNTWAAGHLSIVGDGDPATGARAAIFVAPFVEEAAKATVLFWLAILMRYQWVSRLSGIVLAGLVRCGVRLHREHPLLRPGLPLRRAHVRRGPAAGGLQDLFVLRGLMTFFGHPLFTAMTGIGLAVALRSKSKIVRVVAPLAGYCVASFLHMAFNTTATLVSGTSLLFIYLGVALPLVIGMIIFVVRQLCREGRLIRDRLTDYVRVGWLAPSPTRRLCPGCVPGCGRCLARHLPRTGRLPGHHPDAAGGHRAGLSPRRHHPRPGRPDRSAAGEGAAGQDPRRTRSGDHPAGGPGRVPVVPPATRGASRVRPAQLPRSGRPGRELPGADRISRADRPAGGRTARRPARRWGRLLPSTQKWTPAGSRQGSRSLQMTSRPARPPGTATPLEAALVELRAAVAPIQLPLPLPGAAEQRRAVREITAQLDDYVLPRLATIDAPLLAVVGGSTGAGKSTLVNSLVGRRVTAPGVIRPTTRAPVLVHHASDARWFTDDRILPGLARSTGASKDSRSLQLVVEDAMPPGLALLDAPDIDSVVAENRQLASQLLAAADLWLFVTSAARYADAVPWDFLISAAERSAAVAVVLDRVPPRAMAEIPPHLGQMMSERGLGDSVLFAVPETTTDAEGLLPAAAVQPIRGWLAALAQDRVSRAKVVHQTLDGAIGALVGKAPELARAVDEQLEVIAQLRAEADHSYAEAVRTVGVQSADGTLLRGEVLARWHEFVGTGEFFRALEHKVSWLRDRVVAAFRGEPPGAGNLKVAVESGLESLLRDEADAAAERAEASWQANAAGRQLLEDSAEDLSRSSPEFGRAAERTIRDWQGAVLDLVADEGMGKRSKARFMALGVNGVGVALMIVVFAHTGGLVGAEVGVAGGTAVLAQRVLEAVFGDQAIRRLAETAKEDLDARVQA